MPFEALKVGELATEARHRPYTAGDRRQRFGVNAGEVAAVRQECDLPPLPHVHDHRALRSGLPVEPGEFGVRFRQAGMGELFPLGRGRTEALAGQLDLTEAGVGDATQV